MGAKTGYSVVKVTGSGSSKVLNAPSGSFIVWAFCILRSTGYIVDATAITMIPTFDGSDNITSVTCSAGSITDCDAYAVCVGA